MNTPMLPLSPVRSVQATLFASPPWRGGQFICRGGSCVAQDATAVSTTVNVLRQLGLHAAQEFDGGTLMRINQLIMAGELRMRPLRSVEELAMSSFDVLKALIQRSSQSILFGDALGTALPVSKKTMAIITRPRVDANKVKQLQRALRAANAKYNGRLPVVDGKLGTNTIGALQSLWKRTRGVIPSVQDITDNIDGFIAEIEQTQMATVVKTAPSTATTRAKSTVKQGAIVPKGAEEVGDFTCKNGVCVGNTEAARTKAMSLQNLLNAAGMTNDKAQPLVADGKIGKNTAEAMKQLVRRVAALKGEILPTTTLSAYRPEVMVQGMAIVLDTVRQYLGRRTTEFETAKIAPPTGPLSYQVTSGVATGNPVFRCYVMALQAQLNRLGQKIEVNGVLGQNTVLSVNAVMTKGNPAWKSLGVEQIAFSVEAIIVGVRQAAAAAGAPPIPESILNLAKTRCALEQTQPIVDARLFTSGAVVGPTPAPAPTPTPQHEQAKNAVTPASRTPAGRHATRRRPPSREAAPAPTPPEPIDETPSPSAPSCPPGWAPSADSEGQVICIPTCPEGYSPKRDQAGQWSCQSTFAPGSGGDEARPDGAQPAPGPAPEPQPSEPDEPGIAPEPTPPPSSGVPTWVYAAGAGLLAVAGVVIALAFRRRPATASPGLLGARRRYRLAGASPPPRVTASGVVMSPRMARLYDFLAANGVPLSTMSTDEYIAAQLPKLVRARDRLASTPTGYVQRDYENLLADLERLMQRVPQGRVVTSSHRFSTAPASGLSPSNVLSPRGVAPAEEPAEPAETPTARVAKRDLLEIDGARWRRRRRRLVA